MKIIYWSDYACPYCYIGETRLKKAIATLGIEDKIEIEMKRFELDPTAPEQVVSSTTQRFANKYGLSEEMAASKIAKISELGKQDIESEVNMQRINEKIRIGNMELNGRIMMPSVATYQCDEDGLVTEKVCDYYAQRAKNPYVGLIITEHSYVSEQGKAKKHQMSIASDDCIPGLRNLVDAIHQNGAKVFAQLNHAGSASPEDVINGKAVAPSSVILPVEPSIGNGALPLELTEKDISQIVIQFAESAIRAKEAGYDGVEIHSAHAYLLNQFYSPLTNHRSDEYGGSLINRLKIHREVIQAVRKAVGDDYPISVRIGGCDVTVK